MSDPLYALSETEFQALRVLLAERTGKGRPFSADSLQAAYQVMVQRQRTSAVATAFGMSRQNLSRVVRDLWAIRQGADTSTRIKHRRRSVKAQIPADWVRLLVWLPPALAAQVRQMEEEALQALPHPNDSNNEEEDRRL